MDLSLLSRHSEFEWQILPTGKMRVPGVLYATEHLIRDMDLKVHEQVSNVATLPGIVRASYAMPDAHWGYGFPIGGVAAFDPEQGGVVSAGGVGFDISCGVRTLHTGLTLEQVRPHREALADALYRAVPAGLGSTGRLHLGPEEMEAMLRGGARWAVGRGYGTPADLERIEEHGGMAGAEPGEVSEQAKRRQRDEVGTLGSGNHYLEVQHVAEVFDTATAGAFGIRPGDILVSIHCGSRGLGHQVGTDYLRRMALAAAEYGIDLPDRELACARSTRRWAGPTWAPCGRRSTAPWPTARSSPTSPVGRSSRRSPGRNCRCCTTSRITPASWRSTSSTAVPGACSCTARGRRGLSGQDIRTCRRHCAPSASRC